MGEWEYKSVQHWCERCDWTETIRTAADNTAIDSAGLRLMLLLDGWVSTPEGGMLCSQCARENNGDK